MVGIRRRGHVKLLDTAVQVVLVIKTEIRDREASGQDLGKVAALGVYRLEKYRRPAMRVSRSFRKLAASRRTGP